MKYLILLIPLLSCNGEVEPPLECIFVEATIDGETVELPNKSYKINDVVETEDGTATVIGCGLY